MPGLLSRNIQVLSQCYILHLSCAHMCWAVHFIWTHLMEVHMACGLYTMCDWKSHDGSQCKLHNY